MYEKADLRHNFCDFLIQKFVFYETHKVLLSICCIIVVSRHDLILVLATEQRHKFVNLFV